jgi:hypothetical protein
MNLEKINEKIDSADVVEELLILSGKVFGKSGDDAKKIIEMFITKAYLMGKKNMIQSFDE